MQSLEGQIRCIMGDVQKANLARNSMDGISCDMQIS